MKSVHAFVEENDVNIRERQHFFWQSAHVRADETRNVFRVLFFELSPEQFCPCHANRTRIRVLTVHDETDYTGILFDDALYRIGETQALGVAIKNADAETLCPATLGQEK